MAGRKPRAPRARTCLLAIQRKLARKGATKEEMIAALRDQHPEIIRAEREDIEHLGLMTLANSICNLNLGSEAGMQIEMFEGYDVPRTVSLSIPDATGQIRRVTKFVDSMTKAEARQYVADHDKAPPKQSRTVGGIKRILEDIGASGADDWTLKRCLKAAHDDAKSADL